MRFYIATRLERAADHNAVRDALTALGREITYDWSTHGSVQSEGPERIRDVAERETEGVMAADFVIVLLPGGRGTHVELGLAIAAERRIVVHAWPPGEAFESDGRTCAFYHHPTVARVEVPLSDLAARVAAMAVSHG